MDTMPMATQAHSRPAVVGMPVIKALTTPRYAFVLWSIGGSFIVSTLQLRGSDSTEHIGSLEPHHHPWYTIVANAGNNDTQHPAHSAELGVDIRLAVRRVQRLPPPGAGLPVVPAIPAALAILAA